MIRVLFALMLLATTAAAEVPSTFFGMHILHAVNGTTPWPAAKFGAVRLWDSGVDWHEIATSRGVYNWTNFDKWMSLADQHDVELTYTFGRVPSWANGGQGTMVPMTDMKDWDDFVRAVATRAAGRVKYWEIWNEPNDTHFWSGSVATLVTMAQHAREIIKSIDPDAMMLTPSPTWTATSPDQWLTQYFQAGGGQLADVIAFHGYINASPETIDTLLPKIWSVMNANGQGSKPLWDTEASFSLAGGCGKTTCNPDEQAAWVVRHYLLHLSRNVQRYYWYSWDNEWGTLWMSSAGVLKPGVAYRQAYDWLVGATLSQACIADSAGTWTCGITRPGGYQGLVVWNPKTSVSYTVASQYKQRRDIYGNKSAVASSGVMDVDYRPVLLETTASTSPTVTPPPPPAADFAILPETGETLQVKAGGSATMKLNVSPQGSVFSNPIALACMGPTGSTCKLSPSSVTPGTSTVSTTLTITADSSLLAARMHNGMSLAMWMPLFGVTLVGLRGRRLVAALVVAGALAVCVACGGGATTASKAPEVKTGSYTVTVTGTSGSLQHSVTVPFAVN